MKNHTSLVFFGIYDHFSYLPKLITSLLSIRRFHPNSQYCVFSRNIDDKSRALIKQFDMEYIALDLSHVFAAPYRRGWPSEVFWWLYAYKLFSEQGVQYSCAVDGDLLCIGDLDLQTVIPSTQGLSAVNKKKRGMNSGFVFMNNHELSNLDFYERILARYQSVKECDHADCSGFCLHKSDQDLLEYFLEAEGNDIPYNRLHGFYNLLLHCREKRYINTNAILPSDINEVKMLHLLCKPWQQVNLPATYEALEHAYLRWWEFVKSVWTENEIDDFFCKENEV